MSSVALDTCVITLPHSQGRACLRRIGETDLVDLYQPNPLYFCRMLKNVPMDIDELHVPVSIMLRTHAFQSASVPVVEDAFDMCRAFKTHYVTDLDRPWRDRVHRNANRYDRRARDLYSIEKSGNPVAQAARLSDLHGRTLSRAGVTRRAPDVGELSVMLAQPNIIVFEAILNGSVEGLAVYIKDCLLYTSPSPRDRG